MTARRTGGIAVAAVVAAAALVVVLVAWASTSGPNGVLNGDGLASRHTVHRYFTAS